MHVTLWWPEVFPLTQDSWTSGTVYSLFIAPFAARVVLVSYVCSFWCRAEACRSEVQLELQEQTCKHILEEQELREFLATSELLVSEQAAELAQAREQIELLTLRLKMAEFERTI